jgi:hypothetical protein
LGEGNGKGGKWLHADSGLYCSCTECRVTIFCVPQFMNRSESGLIFKNEYIYIYGGIEMTGRRGRNWRKLLREVQESRGYCHLKEEPVDLTMWRAGFGPVVIQTDK